MATKLFFIKWVKLELPEVIGILGQLSTIPLTQ
jgi:hypothetical protein